MNLIDIPSTDIQKPSTSKKTIEITEESTEDDSEDEDKLESKLKPEELARIMQALLNCSNGLRAAITDTPRLSESSDSSVNSFINFPPHEQYTCTNIQHGCHFTTNDEKLLDRHENWLCTIGTTCLMCFDEFHPDGRMAHLVNHHSDCKRYGMVNNQIAKIICKYALTKEDCQLGMTQCHGKTFFAIFEFSEITNLLFVTTNPDPENECYSIRCRISDTQNEFSVYVDLTKIQRNNEQLYWYTEFPNFSDPSNKFNIVMTIKKWDRNEIQ